MNRGPSRSDSCAISLPPRCVRWACPTPTRIAALRFTAPLVAVALTAAAAFAAVPSAGASARIAEPALEMTPEGDFSEQALRRGVRATRAQCDALANAVWVSTRDHGEACVRYWAAGFSSGPNERAIVFLHGDNWIGPGKTRTQYLSLTGEALARQARQWSGKLDAPYVFIGRPGTHGSSGDHMQRRRAGESALISAALDAIKARLRIRDLVVAGQSGGGHVTSSLLTLRSDIVCAVPTSAPSSPRIRWQLKGLKADTTGHADSYEPSEHLTGLKRHPALRVFVLGDPADRNVLWPSQTIMATRLAQAGVPVETLEGKGSGEDRHGLPDSARRVAGWCYQDLPTAEILRRAALGLGG